MPWTRGLLDPMLRPVADDILAGVMIAPGDLSWVYHPYDGADVLLPSSEQRDQLRERRGELCVVRTRAVRQVTTCSIGPP